MKLVLFENEKSDDLYQIIRGAKPDDPDDYLSFLAKPRIEEIQENFSEDNVEDTLKNIEVLREMWRRILTDAIFF